MDDVWRKNIDRYDTHFRSKIAVVLQQAKEVVDSEIELVDSNLKDMSIGELESRLNSVSTKLEEMDNTPAYMYR